MKIRNGFVSNSSSSSFMIYGGAVDASLIDDFEAFEKRADKLGISLWEPDGYYSIYAGVSLSDMEMDETRREFEARVKQKLDQLFQKQGVDLEEVYFGLHSETWYG